MPLSNSPQTKNPYYFSLFFSFSLYTSFFLFFLCSHSVVLIQWPNLLKSGENQVCWADENPKMNTVKPNYHDLHSD